MNIAEFGANLMATAVLPAITAIIISFVYRDRANHIPSNAWIGLLILITSGMLVVGSLAWIWG